MKSIDLTGKKFGKWIVLEKAERPISNSPSKPLYWKCKCECGNERIIPAHNLRCKRTTNCGCENILPDFRRLYNHFLSSNEGRVNCKLKFDDFVKFTNTIRCHYCNSEVKWTKHGKGQAYNLDRKDSNKEYSIENCVVCCSRCNFGKSNRFSYDEWYEMTECFRKRNDNFSNSKA